MTMTDYDYTRTGSRVATVRTLRSDWAPSVSPMLPSGSWGQCYGSGSRPWLQAASSC